MELRADWGIDFSKMLGKNWKECAFIQLYCFPPNIRIPGKLELTEAIDKARGTAGNSQTTTDPVEDLRRATQQAAQVPVPGADSPIPSQSDSQRTTPGDGDTADTGRQSSSASSSSAAPQSDHRPSAPPPPNPSSA